MKKRSFLKLVSVVLLFTAQLAMSAFDPVNDDTDIFLANPNITAERPNVLIILDNTANWNTAFINEKSALVQVVNGLSDQYNVGLMMFPETGTPNDNVDGGYVKYHVRQMLPGNKTALSSIVNNLDKLADKGNNATTGLAMYEAYLYYAGKASLASFGKVKTDFAGNTTFNPLAAPLTGHALPANPNASSLYTSPATDACQRNFIIYISNGPASENASARSKLQSLLAALVSKNPPDTIGITPSGQQANWADEMAKYMANADVITGLDGVQNVITYTVEVDPGTTGQGPDMTALLKSMATNGKGKYFAVTSGVAGTAIVDALNAIFSEVQAVNSVFASTTLPVSVNVRGTNLNQVYVGVFRPDANKAPRWPGNLKLYNLALDPNSSTPRAFLADAANGLPPAVGNSIENGVTGFVNGSATSFWTGSSNFWSYRDPSQNGVGGASDAPDGDLVEKGGAAQQLRTAYAAAQSAPTLRNLYTCTTGSFNNCNTGSPLSATPFSTANTDISAVALQLSTRLVSPLTAFQTKAVAAITDRKPATLTNAASALNVSSLTNGATTRTITTLTTAVPKTVTALTGTVASMQSVGISSITKSGSNFVATAASALPSNFANTLTVTIAGNSVSAYNGTFTISNINAAARTFQINSSGNPGTGTGGTGSVTVSVNSTTATSTLPGHGYSSGQAVTIACATPSQFNGSFNITVIDTDHFTYTMGSSAGAAAATGGAGCTSITASGNTNTATATYTGTSMVGNTSAIISGANPSNYNGTFTISNVTANSFTYTVAGAPGSNSASPVFALTGGSTTVTATTSAPHLLSTGNSVTIAGSNVAGYNGTFTITVTSPTTFTYVTPSVLPANSSATVTASTSTLATVTATVATHGFSVGNSVVIESPSGDTVHPGTYTILTVPNANTFTYSTGTALAAPPSGATYTARPPVLNSKAIATLPTHGYTTGQQVTIAGAAPPAYNGAFTITVVDADTFTYPLTTAPGANTSTSVSASVATIIARATSPGNGFATGDSVTISGASPGAFNGTFTVTAIDADTFTYPIATAQGDASGTIVALGTGATSARSDLINWVRGEDNFADENSNANLTDVRASVHGDVLHSRPAVVNYNRFGSDNDVYVYYGANDGIVHAVKGGYATDASDSAALAPGREAWGFIPQEFFSSFTRMRTNSPTISSSFKKPYFADGPIGVYVKDANNNGRLGDSGDAVNLYIAMRRGGQFIYALDVNNPNSPKFLWKIDNTTAGFSELGQTWSNPTAVSSVAGYSNPILVFGAGYDPAVEDIEPSAVTLATATSVTTVSGTVNRTMGRGIYVVDAITGAVVWSAGKAGRGFTLAVPGMDFAIPSDISMVRNAGSGVVTHGYVGDTGGNVWRIDFAGTNLASSTVTKIAAIGDLTTAAGRRKFLFPPDVVGQVGYDAVLIGSGDREHPFETTVVNRMYMFKDKGKDIGPVTGASMTEPTIIESALFDATTDCIQDPTGCSAGQTQANSLAALNSSNGWFITLGAGEKVIGSAATIANSTFFNTNQPSSTAGGGMCGSNLGIAREYVVSTVDATATNVLNLSNGVLTAVSRSTVHPGGGYLPSPVHVVVTLDGKLVEAVISGTSVQTPTGSPVGARLRNYWYKEID